MLWYITISQVPHLSWLKTLLNWPDIIISHYLFKWFTKEIHGHKNTNISKNCSLNWQHIEATKILEKWKECVRIYTMFTVPTPVSHSETCQLKDKKKFRIRAVELKFTIHTTYMNITDMFKKQGQQRRNITWILSYIVCVMSVLCAMGSSVLQLTKLFIVYSVPPNMLTPLHCKENLLKCNFHVY
jgi:hypothetical protein